MTLQTCVPENFQSCRWGDERTVKRAQTGSEDPHRRERKVKKKSRRLAGMHPADNDPLRDEQERKRLEWNFKKKDRKEKEDEKG